MANRYMRAAGGNWSTAANWELTNGGGESVAAPTASDDVFIPSGRGNVTVDTGSCTAKTLDCTGFTGTLAVGIYQLTIAGNVTLPSSMAFTFSGGATVYVSAAATVTGGCSNVPLQLQGAGAVTLNTNGGTWVSVIITGGTKTVTLSSTLTATMLDVSGNYGGTTFAGAYGISVGTLRVGWYYAGVTVTFVSGQNIGVSTALQTTSSPAARITVQSSTASSSFYLHYAGTPANCNVSNVIFTDVDASGSAQPIDNWYGGTLTRCTGITNRTSADFATAAQAGSILSGTTISGVAGTFSESGRNTDPGIANVASGVNYKIQNTSLTGTMAASSGGGLPVLGGSIIRGVK